jgi:hypothetical protein
MSSRMMGVDCFSWVEMKYSVFTKLGHIHYILHDFVALIGWVKMHLGVSRIELTSLEA